MLARVRLPHRTGPRPFQPELGTAQTDHSAQDTDDGPGKEDQSQ